MHSKNTLTEKKQLRRKRIVAVTLYAACLLLMGCAIYQCSVLFIHCGRDFRFTRLLDARYEQIVLMMLEMILAIAGIVGLSTKRTPIYFLILAALVCTVMICHFTDVLRGCLYLYNFPGNFKNIGDSMLNLYENYDQPLTKAKVDRIHHCNKCCGVNGTDDKAVKRGIYLLPSCCPDSTVPCTASNAYKIGCAKPLLAADHRLLKFQLVSIVSVVSEFYIYRLFLTFFVV
ncbi:uncharacterized protein LOC126742879 [Anthonomus grandis grandis]|uniref:uncharacterized protein LOC126742879 n=1 Tax=Anthonomus grandis grandis TaxID=2921223 RepID=UPI00216670A1|nr:uncharacterized protein LOC126742879 [Anthonomus grandis grandis]